MEDRASQYHREMSMFIMEEVDEGVTTPSKSEPGKLARLSSMQFQELATDVYDELKRRQSPVQGMPFLHVRDHYHPKRNQARQKLATLSRLKFVDLVHDVNEELKRRFPHKTEASQRYTPSPHGMSYESLNMSPGYGTHPGQQQYQRSYSQNSSEHSPPISAESAMSYPASTVQGVGSERGSAGNHSVPHGIPRDGSFNSVDQLSNDPGHASNNGYQGPNPGQRVRSGETRGVYSAAGEIEKLKNEYESRLAAMRKRVGHLESQLLDNRGDNPHEKHAEQLDNLERLNNVLTQKNERLENDIKIIHDQLMSTKADLPAMRQENDQLKQERAQSIERERDLKARLDEARATIRKFKRTSVFAMDHGDADIVPPPVFVNSGGVIRPSSVRLFQEAVEVLLSAVRSENMEHDLPVAQQAVDAACLGLKADVHGYQAAHSSDPDAWPLSTEVNKSTPGTLETLDINHRRLVEAVDKHLGSMGVLPVSLLEAAASHLATSVVDLVKLLKVCFDESKAAPRQQAGERQSLEESTDNIIAGIQNMLQLVRSSVPDPNALFSTLHTVINSIRLTTAICRTEFEAIESGSATNGQINIQLYSPQSARGVLSGLDKGDLQLTDQLNDISEAQEAAGDEDIDNEIVRELLSEMAFKQSLTSALIDVGKLTKTLVLWLE
ncbi:component of the polarisome [Coemansia sp. RSA 988]|nr:component of the polarisome [Coemansia sp. RSA 988]